MIIELNDTGKCSCNYFIDKRSPNSKKSRKYSPSCAIHNNSQLTKGGKC